MLLGWIHDYEQMQVYVSNKHSYAIAMNTCFWNLDAVSVLCTLVCKMSTSRLYVVTSYYFRCVSRYR